MATTAQSPRPPAVVLGDLSLVRPLGRASIPIVLAALGPRDVASRSRYVVEHREVPGFDPPDLERSAAILLDLGAELAGAAGRRVPLFYNSDKHLELIYRHRSRLAAHYLFLLNEEDTAWALHDKSRFYRLCERAGVLVPRTLQSAADLDARLAEIETPVLVKPKLKTSWRRIQRELLGSDSKARVFPSGAALREHPAFPRYKDEIIVQEYLAGDASRLCSFHGFADERGRVLASYTGRKIRTYPMFAGESSFVELTRSPELTARGREVVERLGLRGVFKIDFLHDERTGRFYTLEINARYNLWNELGAVNGVNLPAIAYDWLVDGREPAAEPEAMATHRWLDLYRDYQAFRDERRRGALSLVAWLTSIADPNIVYETFAWSDPRPFATWLADFVRERVEPPRRRPQAPRGDAPQP